MRNLSAEVLRNPGSDEAIKMGCSCPVTDNHKGVGVPFGGENLYWINGACKLHGDNGELYEDSYAS